MAKSALSIEQNMERMAEAQERSATALEAILAHLSTFEVTKIGELLNSASHGVVATKEEPAAEKPATEKPAAEEKAEVVEDSGADAADPLSDSEDDPLGGSDVVVPDKLDTDVLRGIARQLMEKEGKVAVFETLASIGKGYKAVGEVPEAELREGYLKMAQRLHG